MLIFNIVSGNFTPGFNTPGIIAHSEHLWNILGMYAVRIRSRACRRMAPLRQLILAGQGSSDSAG